MIGAVIVTCTCVHPFQDATYGPGKRVHSATMKQDGRLYRCTVCSTERTKENERR